MHAGIYPLGADTPQEQTLQGTDTLPGPASPKRHPPEDQTPPGADNPWDQIPPIKQTPAYSQQAAGMHPIGMHSCYLC